MQFLTKIAKRAPASPPERHGEMMAKETADPASGRWHNVNRALRISAIFIRDCTILLGIVSIGIGGLGYYSYLRSPGKMEFGFQMMAHTMFAIHVMDVEVDGESAISAANAAIKEVDPRARYIPYQPLDEASGDGGDEDGEEDKPAGSLGLLLHPTDQTRVIRVYPDSPADRAGVQEGDLLIELDDERLVDTDRPQHILDLRRFPADTDDRLQFVVERGGDRLDLGTTDGYSSTTLAHDMGRLNGVQIIRLTAFTWGATASVREILEEANEDQSVTSVLFDLRRNPGGQVIELKHIAGLFLPRDSAVMHYYRDGVRHETVRTSFEGNFPEITQVGVLIDRHSASASEALASVIAAYDLGPVAGETSFGKGSVQGYARPRHIDSHALYGTLHHYTGPEGAWIQGVGVNPDIEVETLQDGSQDWDGLIDRVTKRMASELIDIAVTP